MKFAQSVLFGAWLLIVLNLLMAFGSIWIFLRMAPAIEIILAQNQVSLQASEEMLAALLTQDRDVDAAAAFRHALERAEKNITEEGERPVVAGIRQQHGKAFAGDEAALERVVGMIGQLADINSEAMRRADSRARQLGYAGAWGVVFMAIAFFLVGMLFLRSMKRNLADPMEEIDAAVMEYLGGNTMRRCVLSNPPRNIRQLFDAVNDVLDRHSAETRSAMANQAKTRESQ